MFNLMRESFRYSSEQFGLWRILFGFYLTFYYLRLLPYSVEVYSHVGAFPRIPYWKALHYPNWLLSLDTPETVQGIVAVCAASSFFIMIGVGRRVASFILWLLITWLYNRNSYTNSPDYSFINWLVFILIGIPSGEALSLSKRDPDWKMPPAFYWGAWIVLSLGYMVAGYTKITHSNSGWLDGSALYYVLTTDNTRMEWYGTMLDNIPEFFFWPLTWGTIILQVCAPVFAASRVTRFGWWLAATGMHCGILFFVNLPQVTVGMILFHLFLWDSNWTSKFRLKFRRTGRADRRVAFVQAQ